MLAASCHHFTQNFPSEISAFSSHKSPEGFRSGINLEAKSEFMCLSALWLLLPAT